MKFDVSDIKTFRSCQRQWKFTSRNRFHLQPVETPPQLIFGTIFHEALHALYMGSSLDKVMADVKREMNPEKDVALLAMIPGYAKEVLPQDLDRFVVLEIEHKFNIPAGEMLKFYGVDYDYPAIDDIELCGSVDMVALDPVENKIYFFEHKTCKDFRDPSYLWMDEQPRLYYGVLAIYVDDYNLKHPDNPVTIGGVYLNEVRKLLRKFQYLRTLCNYPDEDMHHFIKSFVSYCIQSYNAVKYNQYCCPHPDYFKCKMCSYSDACATYMYQDVTKEQLLSDFGSSIKERETDHLDEKAERSNNND